MAKFEGMIPNEIIKQFDELASNSEDMINEMLEAAADVVVKNVKSNARKSFKDPTQVLKGLKVTKIYKTSYGDGSNIKIGFYGHHKGYKTKQFPQGVPYDLIAKAREYGTKMGEKKKPFFWKSFKKKEIEAAMLAVQDKYIKGD